MLWKGVPHDLLKAADWIREAALQGIGEAQFLLDTLTKKAGAFIRLYSAAKWYRMAASKE